MTKEEVFNAGLGAWVVIPEWYNDVKKRHRFFQVMGYRKDENRVDLKSQSISTLVDVDRVLPIRLTQIILHENCKFNLLANRPGIVYSNGKMNLKVSPRGNVYTMRGKLIPYLHDLQKVYYCHLLTGEELTVEI